jgi:hypothetical protein
VGIVGIGFRVRGNVAGFAFALALLGLLRGLVVNIGLLGARSVVVVNPVPGMNEGAWSRSLLCCRAGSIGID